MLDVVESNTSDDRDVAWVKESEKMLYLHSLPSGYRCERVATLQLKSVKLILLELLRNFSGVINDRITEADLAIDRDETN